MNSPSATSLDDHSPITRTDWRPDELGFARALLLASVAVILLVAGLAALAGRFVATPSPPPPVAVRLVEPTAALSPLMQAEAAVPDAVTTVPPPPIAESAPPVPEPIALPTTSAPDIAPPMAAPSRTALLPPKPVARPAPPRPARPRPSFASTKATATKEAPDPSTAEHAAPPFAPTDTTSGLGPYRTALHRQIERNMLNNHEVQRLGVNGKAVIEASIAPDGRVFLARIARGSGNRAIDQAALAAVQRGGFAAFGAHMPSEPITISVPIGIEME